MASWHILHSVGFALFVAGSTVMTDFLPPTNKFFSACLIMVIGFIIIVAITFLEYREIKKK